MKAKTVNEIQHFERDVDPKKSIKIGEGRFKIPPSDISFMNSSSSDEGRGFGNDNAKVLIIIKGKTTKKGRAFMRGDGMPSGNEYRTGSEPQKEIYDLITDFLNLPETKVKISEILEKTF
jgi:hypothetical protein